MKIPNRIQWHEGMLISPQHFQVESARIDNMIALHTIASAGYSWGIRRCKFDVGLLASGRLRVLELNAFMPNGFAVEHNVNSEKNDSLELDLDSFKAHLNDGPLNVYLAMATNRSVNSQDGISMFRSLVSEPVKDEVSHAVDADIPRLKPVLKLFAGNPPSGAFTFFRLCSIVSENDVIHLAKTLPPIMDLTAAPELLDDIKRLVEILRGKATFIARQISGQKDMKKSEEQFLMSHRLNLLVTGLPMIEGIIQSQYILPFNMYLALSNLLGPLSQIREGALPPSPPYYDHDSPYQAFKYLLKTLNDLLNEVSQDYREIPFVWNDNFFELALRKEWIKKTIIVGTKGLKSSDAEEWMTSAMIGSKKTMANLKEKRVLGSKRRKVKYVDELHLKTLPGISFFEILTPKDLSENENRLIISASSRTGVANKPESLLLFVKG